MRIAYIGDAHAQLERAGGVLGGDEPDEAHELRCGREPTPVADLGRQADPAETIDTAVRGQAGDLARVEASVEERHDVCLDRLDLCLIVFDHGEQMSEAQRRSSVL